MTAADTSTSENPLQALGIRTMSPADLPQIERLDERAFGPGRFARTAYRLREGRGPEFKLSYVAHVGTLLVGSNLMSAVECNGQSVLLLGPLTVDPAFQSRGIGETLMKHSLDAARKAGYALAFLVGDEPYYARAGFKRVPAGRVRLPGPVDPARMLYCELKDGAFEGVNGVLRRPR